MGHFRHESGHYFWERLVADDDALRAAFRERFGDERTGYAAALRRYCEQGPLRTDWKTAYATAHPWEDWAETWAHYLHLVDTLETAAAMGVSVPASGGGSPGGPTPFDALLARWTPLTAALNELNRSMGQPDLYPFVLPPPAVRRSPDPRVRQAPVTAPAGPIRRSRRGRFGIHLPGAGPTWASRPG